MACLSVVAGWFRIVSRGGGDVCSWSVLVEQCAVGLECARLRCFVIVVGGVTCRGV